MIKFRNEKVIDVEEWDRLVSETYGRPYSLQQQDGCVDRQRLYISAPEVDACDFDRDSIPEVVNGDVMGVSFEAWLNRDPNQPLNSLDEWDRKYGIDLFWQRNFYPSLGVVINDLHKKGLIPTGVYVIDIDW